MNRFAALIHPPVQDAGIEAKLKPRQWLGLAGAALAALLGSIDQRLGTDAQRDLIGGYGLGSDEGSWLYTAYLVGFVGIVPLTPWLAQIFSPRRMIPFFTVVFAIANMLCPDAPDYRTLMALRAIQGFAQGGLTPLFLVCLLQYLPKRDRPVGFAVYVLLTTTVPLVCESIAGVDTDLITWQTIFYMTAPLTPVAVVLAYAFLPNQPIKWPAFLSTDYFSLLCLFLAACMVAAGLDQGQRLDWFDNGLITALFAGAAFFLIAFVINDLTTAKPLVDLRLLGRINFAIGLILVIVFDLAILGPSYLMPQEEAMLRDLKPLQVGNILLWLLITQAVSAPLMVFLIRRIDARLLVAFGLLVMGGGLYMDTFVTPPWDGDDYMLSLVIQAAAWPLAFGPLVFLTTSVLTPEDSLSGGTMFNFIRNLAIAAGSVIGQAIVTVRERVHSNVEVQHVVPGRFVTDYRLLLQGPTGVAGAVRQNATVQAFADCFGWLSLACLLGIVLLLFEKEVPITISRPD
jgi:DHA2 family multidrug resistance protein